MTNDDYQKVLGDKQRILVVMAHPDDAEILCGGLIARATKDGKSVRLVVMTTGGKGFQDREDISEKDFGELRQVEQLAGGKILGIKEEENFNLGEADGEVDNSMENIGKIVFHIRQFRPDVVITHNVDDNIVQFNEETFWVNHRDHRHTGQVVLDAIYPYCRDRGFFPDQFESGLSQHKVMDVLFTDVYRGENLAQFEITDFVDQKSQALTEHKSAVAPEHVADYVGDYLQPDGRYREIMKWLRVY